MSATENSVEKAGIEVKKSPEPPPKPAAKDGPPKAEADKKPSPAPTPTPNSEAGSGEKLPTFLEQFKVFSKFGDTKSDGKHLTLSQSDKWMKQAQVIDGKKITTTDTGIYFKKFKQMKIGYADYGKFLEELAKVKKIEVTELKTKMRSCGTPGTTGTTAVVKSSAVERLSSDNSKKGADSPRGKAGTRA